MAGHHPWQGLQVIAALQQAEQLADEWANNKFTDAEIAEAWGNMTSPPAPTPVFLQQRLLEVEAAIEREAEEDTAPWYAERISTHRAHLENCAFSFTEAPDELFYWLYAKQQPINNVFLKGVKVPTEWPEFDANDPTWPMLDPWLQRFDLRPFKYVSEKFAPRGEEQIWVWQNVEIDGDFLSARCEPVLFEDLFRTFPPPARKIGHRTGVGRAVVVPSNYWDRLMEEFPWLTPDDIRAALEHEGGGGGGGHGAGGGAGAGGHGGPPEPALHEDAEARAAAPDRAPARWARGLLVVQPGEPEAGVRKPRGAERQGAQTKPCFPIRLGKHIKVPRESLRIRGEL